MATGGNGVDEVAQEAGTPDKTTEVACKASKGDTREDQGAAQVWNQNESGVLMALPRKAASWAAYINSFFRVGRMALLGKALSWDDKLCLWLSRPVSQCSYIVGDSNIRSYKIIYRGVIVRSSKTPYPLKFQHPTHTITGIACVPRDNKTSSPEAEVVSGGVGCKEVEILLTPVEEGDWACCVQIVA